MKSIVEDTRQKSGKHKLKNEYWTSHETNVIRCGLPFADYWPVPRVAIDTKANIEEIALNLCGSAKETRRVREEVKKARDAGTKLIFLIEDSRFTSEADLYGKKIWLHNGRTIPGDQLATAMHVMSGRYGCEFWFTPPDEAGRVIQELLEDGR